MHIKRDNFIGNKKKNTFQFTLMLCFIGLLRWTITWKLTRALNPYPTRLLFVTYLAGGMVLQPPDYLSFGSYDAVFGTYI